MIVNCNLCLFRSEIDAMSKRFVFLVMSNAPYDRLSTQSITRMVVPSGGIYLNLNLLHENRWDLLYRNGT